MSPSSAGRKERARAEALRRDIVRHERKYYVDNDPQISDAEFDRLMAELRGLETRFPELVTPESPTQRVGEKPVEGFASVVHRTPMLSIDNGYDEDEIREFEGRVRKVLGDRPVAYTAELKIDGLGISVLYRDGKFARAVTRGDGVRGDDVSANVKTVRSLPLVIAEKGRGRGPRRDLPALRLLPRDQPRPRGGRRGPLRQSPERGGGLHPPPRSEGGGRPEPGRLPLHPVRRRPGGGEPVGRPAPAQGARPPDQSPLALLPDPRRGPGLLPGVERPPRRPRIRRRRHRRQGRLRRGPAGARDDGQIAALGRLLQVPGPPGDDARRRHRRPGRPDRRADARGRPGAGQAVGDDHQPLDPPQRGGAAAEGRPRRRLRAHREERRRHPPGRLGHEGEAAAGRQTLRLAGPVPRLRHGGLPARRGGHLPLRQRLVPGPGPGIAPPFRLAPGHGHRRAGRGGRRPAPRRGARPLAPRPLRPPLRGPREARAPGAEERAETSSTPSRARRAAAWPASSSRWASATSASAWPRPWPDASGASKPSRPPAAPISSRWRTSAPRSPRASCSFSPSRPTASSSAGSRRRA